MRSGCRSGGCGRRGRAREPGGPWLSTTGRPRRRIVGRGYRQKTRLMGLGRQFAAFAGVQLVEQGAADLVGRQVESDAPTLDADDAGEIAECQVDGVQAGNQRRAARLGFVDQQADGVQGQRRVEGGYRFVGQDQVGLLVEHAGDADALQLAAG